MIDLSCLGIDAQSSQVYRYLLENSGRAHPAAAPGLPAETLAAALAALAESGLVRRADGTDGTETAGRGTGGWTVIDPATAVERLIDRRFTELNDDLRRVTAVRAAIPELCATFRSGRAQPEPMDIERLEGLAEIRARLDDLAFFARQEVLALQPSFSPALIACCRPLDLRCLRRGLSLRTVVTRDAVENPVTLSYLKEIIGLGAQVRVTDRAVERLLSYDGKVTVVPVDPQDTARGALVIRQAGLVTSMVRLFEEIWSSAQDIAVSTDATPLSPAERQVLRILCEVDKDEVGARQMGVSLRTFRRYVADLMQRLNAANRFHAAMLAKEAGWI
ncbi:hypothetical protein GCM10010193_36430 [Kitasatospora atroaurantiaca]|uniref:Regulatory LuxR family protein n=1 Tax=Kitasatospora atroaurantiaca TaxID=285545 RepID=A0A561ET65_9ACTN|nr:helix-turn-helix transcriptional regulator [Kitasatospora atroaurantiaca]TWE18812.1 regulatory LuxR family protein [Kitasatospora atroaurantiaca]